MLRHVRSAPSAAPSWPRLAGLTSQVRHVLAEADATLHGAVRDAFVGGGRHRHHVRRQPAERGRGAAGPRRLPRRLAGIGKARRREAPGPRGRPERATVTWRYWLLRNSWRCYRRFRDPP